MERRLETKEAERGRILVLDGEGEFVRCVPAKEQVDASCCSRCAGLLVSDWCYDLENTDEYMAVVFRCVQCGNRVDPVILRNQRRLPADSPRGGRSQHNYAVSTAMSGEAA